MLEPFHRCPGKPERAVLALRLGVSRDLKGGSLHLEQIGYGWFHYSQQRKITL